MIEKINTLSIFLHNALACLLTTLVGAVAQTAGTEDCYETSLRFV